MVGHSPLFMNQYGTFEEFLASVEERPEVDWRPGLTQVSYNKDVRARVAIFNWMLDHGASLKAQCRGDKVNVLHAFFFERVHDFSLEAPLLQRLLDAGANINQYSPRFSLPLKVMLDNFYFRDEYAGLVYDVIFSRPDVDWEAFADVTSGERRSLRFFCGAYEEASSGVVSSDV